MNWVFEQPRTASDMWNIICCAAAERREFYGLSSAPVAEMMMIPCRKNIRIGTETFVKMQHLIADLVYASFDVTQFGCWNPLDKEAMNASSPALTGRNMLLEKFGIDGYTFWTDSPSLPYRRHTFSDWLLSAAMILNNVVRYPAPLFDASFSNETPARGFIIEGDALLVDLEKSAVYSGKLSNGSLRVDTDDFFTVVSAGTLGVWERERFKARTTGLHWIYHRPGERINNGYISYLSPLLHGECKLRSLLRISGRRDSDDLLFFNGYQTETIDFSSGRAIGNIDISSASDEISEVWNSDEESIYDLRRVSAFWEKTEVMLTEENFDKLSYKYLEK